MAKINTGGKLWKGYRWLLIACCFIVSGAFPVYGQSRLPLGAWQLHVPYQQALAVADAGDKVYCATENGLFYFDKEFNNIQTITKVDGLKEQRISAIHFDVSTKTFVIAYLNTQIDLLRGGKIINISDVFRRTVTGRKTINHIQVHDKLAYLSCSFGMVVLDLVKLEVKDTYSNLGPAGETVHVHSSAILRDSIFLATDRGVLGSKRIGVNLKDFASWANQNNGLPDAAAATILTSFNDRLYTGTKANGVFSLSGKVWVPATFVPEVRIVNLKSSASNLLAVLQDRILVIAKSNTVTTVSHALLQQPRDVISEAGNILWAADYNNGLIKLELSNGQGLRFLPSGPFTSKSFSVYAGNGIVYSMSGGYDTNYQVFGFSEGFSEYQRGEWQNYNSTIFPDRARFPDVKDLVKAVFNPVTGKMYFGSYGSGLLEWNGAGDFTLYNDLNSTLLHASNAGENPVRVTSVATDAAGNVWVVNRHQLAGRPGLHVLRTDKTWQSFILPGVVDGGNLEHLVIDDHNQKWLTIARSGNLRSGLVVYDSDEQRVKYLSTGIGSGGLPSGAVYCLAKDMLGDIWVGTASGVAVYYSPGYVFLEQQYDARIPVINGSPLLDGQIIRAIGIDGGNRKWIGTDNGLWVFSPDGTELVHHFNAVNSPMPSDKVLSVAVEHKTGEVFVSTDAGIASYRLGATVTEGNPDCAVVFPNPVRRDHVGLIGLSGLANNAQVRITDINGTLIYKGQAAGGTFTWDARGYNGKRVKAGVYLALSSAADGAQACISKIAILD